MKVPVKARAQMPSKSLLNRSDDAGSSTRSTFVERCNRGLELSEGVIARLPKSPTCECTLTPGPNCEGSYAISTRRVTTNPLIFSRGAA